jgi:hypothetical protein
LRKASIRDKLKFVMILATDAVLGHDLLARELDEALTCLEKSISLGRTQKAWAEHDSNLDPLRNLSRFQQLLRKLA